MSSQIYTGLGSVNVIDTGLASESKLLLPRYNLLLILFHNNALIQALLCSLLIADVQSNEKN
jgi:hypothetical protein